MFGPERLEWRSILALAGTAAGFAASLVLLQRVLVSCGAGSTAFFAGGLASRLHLGDTTLARAEELGQLDLSEVLLLAESPHGTAR